MSAPEHDWPEWMDLGKAECGWSNIAADEGNRQRYVRADIVQELAEAVEGIVGYVPLGPVECRGDKCREPWCISCYGEEYAEGAVKVAESRLSRTRTALARYRGGAPD